jgi:anti-sigma factor RsiW
MRMTDDLSCKELVEIVTAYLEGTLPVRERMRFEDHLSGCPGCVNYLEQMRTTIKLTGTLSEDMISIKAQQTLLELFRDWKNTR